MAFCHWTHELCPYRLAQPALLYLVPAIMVPLVVAAWRQGHLVQLWEGMPLQRRKDDLEQGVLPSDALDPN